MSWRVQNPAFNAANTVGDGQVIDKACGNPSESANSTIDWLLVLEF